MRLAKLFCLAVLVAMSAAVVQAGPITSGSGDPAFTINKCVKSCDQTLFGFAPDYLGLSKANPLVIDYTSLGSFNFEYTGTKTLDFPPGNLWLQIEDIPSSSPGFSCVSSSLFTCGPVYLGTVADSLEWSFTGGPLTPDEILTVRVAPSINELTATPEPGTMLLFLSLGPAIGFAKKRWNAKQSA